MEHKVVTSRVLIAVIIVGSVLMLTAGAALAAGSAGVSSSREGEANHAYVTKNISDTEEISGTEHITGSQMIAGCIAAFFEVPVSDVVTLRTDGYGFGEMAAAYFLARDSGLSVAEILELREQQMGWGEIAQYLGLPTSHRDRNLGQIISGHLPVSGTLSAAAERLAERLGTTPEEVQALLDDGAGYGTIVVAYKLAGQFEGVAGATPEELIEKRLAGSNWGQIKRELSAASSTETESEQGPPDHAGPPEDHGQPNHPDHPDHPDRPDNAGPKDNNKKSK